MNRRRNCFALLAVLFAAPSVRAEGWCDLMPGWAVVTHGTKADNVFVLGQFQGSGAGIWIQIATATVGKANVALALGAQFAGRNISIYVDSPAYNCATFPSWAPIGEVRHIRVLP
jgi:hypothetical protein